MTDNFKPNTRENDIVVQELAGETLVYDLKTNQAYCLNETSALVWQLCDGKRTVSEISDEMSKKLKTLISKDFILIALDQLNKDGLLEEAIDLDNQFAGLSRRDIIRKVGFASIVALPAISSLVAPEALNAQSACIATGDTCPSGSGCCSGNCLSGIGIPQTCCVTTATDNRAAGTRITCTSSAVACSSLAATGCCSGSASLAGVGVCTIPGAVECVCN